MINTTRYIKILFFLKNLAVTVSMTHFQYIPLQYIVCSLCSIYNVACIYIVIFVLLLGIAIANTLCKFNFYRHEVYVFFATQTKLHFFLQIFRLNNGRYLYMVNMRFYLSITNSYLPTCTLKRGNTV